MLHLFLEYIPNTLGRIKLNTTGEKTLTFESWCDQCTLQPRSVWIRAASTYNTSGFRSNRAANAVDYYFFFGGNVGRSISLYREATGAAPLPPRGIFGFMHSKDRYHNQSELVEGANGFRQGGYPLDTIVQDWYFWRERLTLI